MRKTTFAGLTVLDPEESLLVDGASFQARNPLVTDHLLRVGAVSHRHDEHSPLANPASAASAVASPTGGGLAGNTSYYVGYTLLDEEGGETAISPVTVVTTPQPIPNPIAPPALELVTGVGDLRGGIYAYEITFTDDRGGETRPGPDAAIERPLGYASAAIQLSGMAEMCAQASATGWRAFKSGGNGIFRYLASGTAADDSLLDDGTICLDCIGLPPQRNSTRQTNLLAVTVPPVVGATGFRLWISDDGDFNASLMGEYPMASAGVPINFPQIVTDDGAPPDVSLAIGGAHKIDPASELASAAPSVWTALGVPTGGGGGGGDSTTVARRVANSGPEGPGGAHPTLPAWMRAATPDVVEIVTTGPALLRVYAKVTIAPSGPAFAASAAAALNGGLVTDVAGVGSAGAHLVLNADTLVDADVATAVLAPPLELVVEAGGSHQLELLYQGAAALSARTVIVEAVELS